MAPTFFLNMLAIVTGHCEAVWSFIESGCEQCTMTNGVHTLSNGLTTPIRNVFHFNSN